MNTVAKIFVALICLVSQAQAASTKVCERQARAALKTTYAAFDSDQDRRSQVFFNLFDPTVNPADGTITYEIISIGLSETSYIPDASGKVVLRTKGCSIAHVEIDMVP